MSKKHKQSKRKAATKQIIIDQNKNDPNAEKNKLKFVSFVEY